MLVFEYNFCKMYFECIYIGFYNIFLIELMLFLEKKVDKVIF